MVETLVGRQFGYWTVLSFLQYAPKRGKLWQCKCRCGDVQARVTIQLTRSNKPSRSCGCYNRERTRETNTKHGMARSPEYHVYQAMLQRCCNDKSPEWHNYGQRGIKVCARWLGEDGFQRFIADVGRRPGKGYSIERRENSKGYSPGNCYWATRAAQNRNTRRNRIIEYRGERLCLTDWAKKLDINYQTLRKRLNSGWDVARALGGCT